MLECYIVYNPHQLHCADAGVYAAQQTPLSFIVKMGSDSACLSDAARSWLEFEDHCVGLSPEDISRLSVTPSGVVALLLTPCTKRVTDGLQDPLYLALLLDP
jgi:hypothetical protein